VIGKKFAGTTDCTEHWYGTEYSYMKLSNAVLQVVCVCFVFFSVIINDDHKCFDPVGWVTSSLKVPRNKCQQFTFGYWAYLDLSNF